MNWGTIIAAAVTAICALVGTYLSNRKQTAVWEYRLKALEDKVGKHNGIEGRTIALETKVKNLEDRIEHIA